VNKINLSSYNNLQGLNNQVNIYKNSDSSSCLCLSSKTTKKTHHLVLGSLLGVTLAGTAMILFLVSSPLSFISLMTVPIGAIAVKNYLLYKHSSHINSSIQHLELNHLKSLSSELRSQTYPPCEGLILKDSVSANEWKLELIKKAERSIILSGSYCGGKIFDQTLELIETRLAQNNSLKVAILSSDFFITSSNRKTIQRLIQKYPSRFLAVLHKEITKHRKSGSFLPQLIKNHMKALIIDEGEYVLFGGSGIQDKWSHCEHKKQFKLKNPLQYILPKRFQDTDFILHCPQPHSLGRSLYFEVVKLIHRWSFFSIIKSRTDIDPFLHPAPSSSLPLYFSKFEDHPNKITGLRLNGFTVSPFKEKNVTEDEFAEKISRAKSSIVINHLYFHPTKKVLNALLNASRKGIKITIITNKQGKGTPLSHRFFALLSKYFCSLLLEGKEKKNVEFYEFSRPDTSLHKKLILIDGEYILTGSSNLNHKSLKQLNDEEINFFIRSSQFHEEALKVVEEDKQYSHLISNKTIIHMSKQEKLIAFIQRRLSKWI